MSNSLSTDNIYPNPPQKETFEFNVQNQQDQNLKNYRTHLLLLGVGSLLALGLRLTLLASKPIWSDEFATLVFSLGQSFRNLPFDVPISLETLLSPLQLNSRLPVFSIPENLLQESNHPPVYMFGILLSD